MSPITLTKNNFKEEVNESPVPVLIDFYAPWCAPCAAIAPTVDELALEAHGFKVAKVNVDEEPSVAEKFGVMSIPTLIVVKNGKVTARETGLMGKADIMKMLQ